MVKLADAKLEDVVVKAFVANEALIEADAQLELVDVSELNTNEPDMENEEVTLLVDQLAVLEVKELLEKEADVVDNAFVVNDELIEADDQLELVEVNELEANDPDKE